MEPLALQPSVDFFGLKISDLSIALTDLAIVVVCFYAFFRLKKLNASQPETRFFRQFFIFTAFSALVGGLFGHAFVHVFHFWGKVPSWILSMIGIYFLANGMILQGKTFFSERFSNRLVIFNQLAFLVFGFLSLQKLTFVFTELYTVVGYLIIGGGIAFFIFRKTKNRGHQLYLWSLVFPAAAGLVHFLKFSLGTWFTYFDIGHLLVCISFWLILRGVEQFSK